MSNLLSGKRNLLASPKISLLQALMLLKKTGKKCIIITDNKKRLLGTLTDGDLRSLIIKEKNLNQSINKLYNPKPRYVYENRFNIDDLRKEIIKNRYELVPIINKSRKVVDVITWDQAFRKKFKTNDKIKNCDVVIIAGGQGERLQPFTSILPKPLIPVQGKSIIEHIISKFTNLGIKNFKISLGYKNRTIRAFFKALKLNCKINFIIEKKPLGTIGALSLIKKNKKKLHKSIFVSNCDILVNSSLEEIFHYHNDKRNDITLVTAAKNILIPYGVCQTLPNGKFKNIEEKPSYSALINTGLYLFKSSILNLIPKNRKFDINDLIEMAKKKNKKIGLFPITDESWIDIGQWNEYRMAAKKLEE